MFNVSLYSETPTWGLATMGPSVSAIAYFAHMFEPTNEGNKDNQCHYYNIYNTCLN